MTLGNIPGRGADVIPTQHYAVFTLAERKGVTVRQLLTGHSEPLTAMEYYLWNRFYAAKVRLEKQARRGR